MKLKSILSAVFLLVLTAFTPTLLLAEPYQQEAVTGLVSIEVEHSDANIARGGYSWVVNTTAGFSADSGLRTSPTTRNPQKDPGYSLTSPQLDYQVNFVETGTHYLWVRGIGDRSSNNSVHVGLDGNEVATSEALNFPLGTSWIWHGGTGVATLEISSPGVHTVNVWMREAGFRIDKLVLTKESGFTPSGTSPLESPRGSGGGANQMPVAVAGGPYSGLEGELINFDGSGSFDLDGNPLTYSWDFGDGSALGSGIAPGHSYTTAGSYTVTLTVNDGSLDSLTSTAQVTVTSAGGGGNVTFGGSQTTASGGNRTSFSVGYDQLGLSVGDVVVVTVTTDYASAGAAIVQGAGHPGGTTVYNAVDTGTGQPRLRVDVLVYDGSWPATLDYTFAVPDNETWIAYATKWTGVDAANPVAGSAGNYDGVTLNPISPGLTAAESGLVAVAVYGAREDDFDSNGTPSGYTPVAIGASNIGSAGSSSGIAYRSGIAAGTVPAAVWTQAAATQAHGVHVLLRSNGGGGANQVPVAVAGGPYGGVSGNSISFDGSASFDPDGNPLTYSWDFGDGSAPGSGVAPSHTYATDGGYTVTLTVNDGMVDSLDSTATVTVSPAGGNQTPIADAGGPYGGVAGNSISFDGSASFDPDGNPLTYSWDFGDGSAPGSGVNPNHTYAAPDTYTVSLIVNDGTVDSVASTAQVTVTSAGGGGNVTFGGSQTTASGGNRRAFSVGYDQLGLSVGDVVVVTVTTDYASAGAAIVQGAGHPGGTTVYNAVDTGTGQPRLRVDVLVYDGSWSATLDYTFAVPDNETWIAYATKWTGVDAANPVAGSAGNYDGVTLNPISPGLTAAESGLVAVAVYGAREDDFDSNGTPSGYTPVAIGASNIGSAGSSSGIAYRSGIAAGTVAAAVWTQAAATQAHGVHVLLRSNDGTPPPTPVFADDFNDGNLNGWSVDDECLKGSSSWPLVNNALMQIGDCRGFSLDEGVAIGTQALSSVALPAGADIRLRLRSEDPDVDAPSSNNGSIWKFGSIGVLFGYQNANNYYRFELNGRKGHRKLLRKQGGAFTELNTSSQSFVRGQWMDLRIVHQNGVILVYVDGQQVMSVADATFSAGPLGLFCSRDASCSFDDISVLNASTGPQLGLRLLGSTAPAEPALPVQSYSEYFVDTNGVLDVVAVTTSMAGVGGVEFVVDEGVLVNTTSVEVSVSDLVAPYRKQITPHVLSSDEHTVTAYLLDSGGVRMTAPAAKVTLPGIATNGIHLFTQGDSITAGLFDDLVTDDTSLDTRNTAGGYQPKLNDYLSGDNPKPVTVLNDGNSGETSWEGAARIVSTLANNPEAQAYVMFYGANDSGGSMPTPPFDQSLDEQTDTDNPVTFKDYLQVMINAVVGANKQLYLVKAPPYFANLTRDGLVQQYNQVVDQLILENSLGYGAADLHDYFTLNPSEYSADGIHPDGDGYAAIARKICEQLNGQAGLTCIP